MRKLYQSSVLARYMNEQELAAFDETYGKNLDSTKRHSRVAEPRDMEILADHLSGLSMRTIRHKYEMSTTSVYSSLRIAALAKLQQ